MAIESRYPVGARVLIRDEEWRITEVDQSDLGSFRIKCTGVSELVRGRTAVFFSCYENDIELLKPETTRIVEDRSGSFIRSRLHLEALLRSAPQNDPARIVLADRAAMDPLPYQFDPALRALSQPRARILIADAVGIGKTLEAGILTSELIARGRGRRILVLATKAMLPQFQREFWTRFTIPLTRLDSAGIQRVKNRLPANHNPFLHFDRAIISIDTLKQDVEYRDHLSKATWDIIIIDEAHNVAMRNGRSQRARLAQLLAGRSDTMIMLSATPHDGRAESFASLLNMLDPTAIPDPSHYGVDDFAGKGLVIRRFKSDVRDQVRKHFPDREIRNVEVTAGEAEQAVFDALGGIRFRTLNGAAGMGRLFSTTLLKAFLSSPDALKSVIDHRLETLERHAGKAEGERLEAVLADQAELRRLRGLAEEVTPERFSKLGRLADMLRDGGNSIGWNRRDPRDRLVVFTESVQTLRFLEAVLPKLIGLKKDEWRSLSGEMKDTDIALAVNEFNRGESPVRLLLCSDVASEGINLHHFAHRMIHFDIPWALMTFQQRNGRIDRYGQTETPQIWYMQTLSATADGGVRSDVRVLERLIERDRQVQENLSDPKEFTLSVEEQEENTAEAIERTASGDEDAFDELIGGDDDFFASLEAEARNSPETPEGRTGALLAPVLSRADFEKARAGRRSLFASDMDYARAMLGHLGATGGLGQVKPEFLDHRILLDVPADLEARLRHLPPEVLPEDRRFNLTDSLKDIEAEMDRCRLSGEEWPNQTLLWPLHPVMLWLVDRALGLFGRHTAPLLRLGALEPGERWLLLEGGYPNRRGFIPVHDWIVIHEKGGVQARRTLAELIDTLGLDRPMANLAAGSAGRIDRNEDGADCSVEFSDSLRKAVGTARRILSAEREEFSRKAAAELERRLAELSALEGRHLRVLDEALEGQVPPEEDERLLKAAQARREHRRAARRLEIERHFDDARRQLHDTAEIEGDPWIQLAAAFGPLAR